MGENCCICFPLECGVKFLAVLILLDAIFMGGFFIANPDQLSDFWPYLAAVTAMALTFLYSRIVQTEESRKFTFLAWIVLMVVTIYALYAF